MYLLGFDIGSSSVKASLVDAQSGERVGLVSYPSDEMEIVSKSKGWAEQNPELWWKNVCTASKMLIEQCAIDPKQISSIGVSYQMHGLVLVDEDLEVIRPSIIWCDSRAVEIGNQAFDKIGQQYCLEHYLNSPGNFTASKLRWVKENEPKLYDSIYKVMLPGDYIAMKLTGLIKTTISGLSEGIMWDFKKNALANKLLDYYGIEESLIPETVGTFEHQGVITQSASEQTGIPEGTPITYRAGDQPNNALSLGVIEPNEVAATCGTSGVVYGVLDKPAFDQLSRVNGFAHVNHTADQNRIGILLCINGSGIQYGWMKNQIAKKGISYDDMEAMMSTIPIGSDGLRIIPFGNGSERVIGNINPGAQINNLQFNRHTQAHLFRAAVEGIAFSFVYGFQLLKELGLNPTVIKVGNDNLFKSSVFSTSISNLISTPIQVVQTTGADGAAKASGIAISAYASLQEAFTSNKIIKEYTPSSSINEYTSAYELWVKDLEKLIN